MDEGDESRPLLGQDCQNSRRACQSAFDALQPGAPRRESRRIQLRNAMELTLKRFTAAVDVVISIIFIARINDQPIRLDRRQIN
jgi:hypothetical protein